MTLEPPVVRPGLPRETAQAIDALFAHLDRPDHPGAAVAVLRGGELIHLRCFGLANVEDEVPVTPQTIMRLGSAGKQMCATAVLMLEDRGLLSLDDPLARHVPETPDCARDVTLRQLLTMTGGLPDGLAMTIFTGRANLAMTRAQHLELFARLDALQYPPGQQMLYSNTGYMLAALVVERVSGLSFGQFLAQEIFAPLGMIGAQLVPDGAMAIPHKARGYLPGKAPREFVAGLFLYEASGDGGVDLSILDLAIWHQAYRENRLGVRDYRARMEADVRLSDGRVSDYRLGVDVTGPPAKVSHAGGMPGYLADVCFYPEADIGVLLLSNWMDPGLLALADPIAGLVEPALPGSPPAPATGPQPGLYVCAELGRALHIDRTDQGAVCFMMGDRSGLLDDGEGGWVPAKRGSCYHMAPSGPDGLEVRFGAAAPVRFELYRADDAPPAVGDYLGAYRSPVLGETHEITLGADGGLRVGLGSALRALSWSALTWRAADVFTADVSGEPSQSNLTLKFHRDGEGRVTGFGYSTFRCRDIRFEKVHP